MNTTPETSALSSLLAGLKLDADVERLIEALHRGLPKAKQARATAHELAQSLLNHLGEGTAWESQRMHEARAALRSMLGTETTTPLPPPTPSQIPLDAPPQLFAETERMALVFAGQANAYAAELQQLLRGGGSAAQLIRAVAQRLASPEPVLGGALDVMALLANGESVSWTKPSLSFPLIFATQAARLHALFDAGVSIEVVRARVGATAGHSQGVFGALYASEALAARENDRGARAAAYAAMLRCFGLQVERATAMLEGDMLAQSALAKAEQETATRPSPMAALSGFPLSDVAALVRRCGTQVHLALDNGGGRCVLSGDIGELERTRRFVMLAAEKRKKDKTAGQWAGSTRPVEWSYLAVDAPFHTPLLASAADAIVADAHTLGFTIGALAVPVVAPDGSAEFTRDTLARAIRSVCAEHSAWPAQLRTVLTTQPTCVLDFGPSDALARMCHANLRGTGIRVLSLGAAADFALAISTRPLPALPLRYDVFAPAVAQHASRAMVDNQFTRAFARPPIFLAGMTPTTVDAPIVAAAANAGFVAELAGGGQVTERLLRLRLDELRDTLAPGQGVVFNALYLDAYLWKLHFGPDRLLMRLRDEGYPLFGVTISAGVPPVDEAAALLRELHAHGMWLNAFKPGNDGQIKDVLAIADACPEIAFGMQIEGGKAGGHHSWEDLDDLLLHHYAEIRKRKNLVLSVGGGIGVPEKAAAYLRGTWPGDRALSAMPVDGVFIGTIAMAAKEALTSSAVKQALCDAAGSPHFVRDGEVTGGVTSGRSQLDAHIYYLDNPAVHAGRLLDAVAAEISAGDKGAAERRREEIIAALSTTAKPYFGAAAAMTYHAFLERLLELTAIGRQGRYEDGVWPDVSFRDRFRMLFDRAEARLREDKASAFEPLTARAGALDDPHALLRDLVAHYPLASRSLLHAADLGYFLDVCRLPGKPVNFVPVIDAEVRRWYKADSLWQSHDERYAASQVFAIPGPEALAGIVRANEPIGEMLARFNDAVVGQLAQASMRTLSCAGDLRFANDGFGHGVLASALRAPDAVTRGRLVHNPLRALFALETAREKLALTFDATGMLSQASLATAEGVAAEAALTNDSLCVRLFSRHAHSQKMVALDLGLRWDDSVQPAGALLWDEDAYLGAQQRFYSELLFGAGSAAGDVPAFKRLTGDTTAGTPLQFAFALSWKEIFAALCEARPNVMALVHESNQVEAGPAWPPSAETIVHARLCEVTAQAPGRHLTTEAELRTNGVLCARVVSRFFVRGIQAELSEERSVSLAIVLRDEAERAWLQAQPWITVTEPLLIGQRYDVACALLRKNAAGVSAEGAVSLGSRTVAQVSGSDVQSSPRAIVTALRMFAADRGPAFLAQAHELGDKVLRTPADMHAYAMASGDLNPLHVDTVVARLAGFAAPIVHGMWTASTATAQAQRLLGAAALQEVHARFTGVVERSEALLMSLRQTGWHDGRKVARLEVRAKRGDERVTVLEADLETRAEKTVYVFPGQGIQSQNMGMAGYARSRAARAVWEEADAVCRRELGFSLLRVVRDNPRELRIGADLFRHPAGVLFLTQFTQAAMAVMAVAQVAELKELGVFVPNALFAGHSIGEYSALAAVVEALPLASVVQIVYQRGATMDHLVTRDRDGHSPYAMGVIRPHDAGLKEADMLALVQRLRDELSLPLEIVNYNIRGKQYSVTGDVRALAALEEALAAAQRQANPKAKRAAYLLVPGIDVPFHSTLLRDGVAEFRQTLDRLFPADVNAARLTGHYIPNLVAQPFALTREFVSAAHAACGSPFLAEALASWDDKRAGSVPFARALLIELLAYQFASPVRWIETQDIFFCRALGLERFVEVGVSEQPVLSNMAKATLALDPVRLVAPLVLNSEGQRDELLLSAAGVSDADPWPVGEVAAAAEAAPAVTATAVTATATKVTPVAAARRASVAVAAPVDAVTSGLHALLAFQSKVREEQIDTQQSLDELLGGNSAKRNQLLADLGAEFSLQAIDGAHEVPLRALAEKLQALAPRYALPGRYLSATIDQHLHKAFGAAGLTRKDLSEPLAALSAEHQARVLAQLALRTRAGESARGGMLGDAPVLKDRATALGFVGRMLTEYAARHGLVLTREEVGSSTAVDPRAVRELEDKLFGAKGVLANAAKVFAEAAGVPLTTVVQATTDDTRARLDLYESEHGAAYEKAIRPCFDALKHAQWTSAWAWARRDVVAHYHALMRGEAAVNEAAVNVAARLQSDSRKMAVALSARAAAKGRADVAAAMQALAMSQAPARFIPRVVAQKPILRDGVLVTEAREGEATAREFLAHSGIDIRGHYTDRPAVAALAALAEMCTHGADFSGRTALVTGASPGSIAFAVVRALLEGGARVIVTTQTYTDARLAEYQSLYTAHAAEGAELHVVPFNQASFQDTSALLEWILTPATRMSAGTPVKVKDAWLPDFIIPFAAVTDVADLSSLGEASLATMRVMLLGVERLLGGLAQRLKSGGHDRHKAHVVLPFSPNHGVFGGDGAYAESKAALETLLDKWRSERAAWGRFFSVVGARIGWVRGTGLMDHNDRLAAELEADTKLRTFSTAEMAVLLVGLLSDAAMKAADDEPLVADVSGGLAELTDLAERAKRTAAQADTRRQAELRQRELEQTYRALLGAKTDKPRALVLPEALPLITAPAPTAAMKTVTAKQAPVSLDDLVVVVGTGELGPWGGSRTRWAMEKDGVLSLEGAIELAWLMGFISPRAATERGLHAWTDNDGGAPISALAIKTKYEAKIIAGSGVRIVEGTAHGFDPRRSLSYVEVHLERDFEFPVQNREEADTFVAADPQGTELIQDGDTIKVRRKRGATVRVPRALKLDRFVAGQIPDGWQASRYGISRELEAQVDRITLYNLIATVEAFLAAGLEPEELYAYLHPSRVASSQSLGLGGMQKMLRLYSDHLLGEERQSDAVQETLTNVVTGYVVQAYTGSYGAMQFPVGACATAAASVADAMAMLNSGVADFVVTGGADDFGEESVTGFGDMNATANTTDLTARGISPKRMCRPNDRRRDGFVESHGAGALLLCRASVALRMALPVYGVVGYAGTFGDGIQQSVPSPGIGALSAAQPLRAALSRFGLSADDIAFISKHDTSTKLNDVNENRMHTWLQETLGRTPHLPLLVVSQKSLTGHPKGAAAAWQMAGALQVMASGVVPGNRNLEDVDPDMREFGAMVFSDRTMRAAEGELTAALVTSLGFGHINGIVLLLHPEHFWRAIAAPDQAPYMVAMQERTGRASQRLQAWLGGGAPLYRQRKHRPFTSEAHEAAVLMNAQARLAPGADAYPSQSEKRS